MSKVLVAKNPIGTSGLLKGYAITVIESDQDFTADDLVLGWSVEISGKTEAETNSLLEVFTRPAVPGEPEYEAQDEPDRIVFLGPRRWYFAFDEIQLATLNTYGGIVLLPGDAEVTIKQTQSGGIYKFG